MNRAKGTGPLFRMWERMKFFRPSLDSWPSLSIRQPAEVMEYLFTMRFARSSTRNTDIHVSLPGQMVDHRTDFLMVDGFMDEAVDTPIDGLFQKGVSPCRNHEEDA